MCLLLILFRRKNFRDLLNFCNLPANIDKDMMLNRIVLTEKDQIATLKVVDELRHVDIQQEMRVIENSLASSNTRKVTLDLENLQVISRDTHELLGLIIKHVRLQNIPISIKGSTQFDPGILLAISEGRPQLIEQKKQKKDKFKIKPKYFSRFSTPFFSTDKDAVVFQTLIPEAETGHSDPVELEKPFQDKKPDDVEIVYRENVADKYSGWLMLGWGMFFGLTGVALTLLVLLWPDYQSGKIQQVFIPDNQNKLAVISESNKSPLIQKRLKISFIQAVKKGNLKAVERFLADGVELEKKDKSGYTPLLLAVKKQNSKLVTMLAEHGANVDITDEFDDTPLIWASSMKNVEIVKILLEHDADPDKGNFTSLMWAAFHGNLPMLKLFLQSRANLNARTHEGWTALMWAAERGNTHAMWEMLERGARVNMQNNRGKTALMLAARQGKIGTVGILINKGGDPDVIDFDKKTAADYARDFQRQDVLQLLEKQFDLQ